VADKIQENVGYHRVLLIACALFLYFFYPTEEVPSISDAGVKEMFNAIIFILPPKFYFLVLTWIGLSDLLANLWRLVDFLRQKSTFWNYYPAMMDAFLLIILWLIYRKYVNPLPEEPEAEEEVTRFMLRFLRLG
jgi:hypothetical protein